MLLVDTSVLVYAADADSPFHARCFEQVQRWRARPETWYTTWGVLYEFLRVTTHARVMRNPWTAERAWGFVAALLAGPGLAVLTATERHAEIAAQVIADLPHLSGNLFHDTHTAVLMREHGVNRIYTRDSDFHRFPFPEVIDPVA